MVVKVHYPVKSATSRRDFKDDFLMIVPGTAYLKKKSIQAAPTEAQRRKKRREEKNRNRSKENKKSQQKRGKEKIKNSLCLSVCTRKDSAFQFSRQ